MRAHTVCTGCFRTLGNQSSALNRRYFHKSDIQRIVKPFLLADIGEGTRECQIIQWFVQPGARVEQFDKICEVQSDKAATDITSPFDGIIKRLHYEADDMAIVGKPLVDIDIQDDVKDEDHENSHDDNSAAKTTPAPPLNKIASEMPIPPAPDRSSTFCTRGSEDIQSVERVDVKAHTKTLATPAVRHLIKQLGVEIEDIKGSGKDGRVTKEDVQKHASNRSTPNMISSKRSLSSNQEADKAKPLSPIQSAMFKTMTRSLSIPHFLYTMSLDLSSITNIRQRINARQDPSIPHLSPLPFIIKAISIAFEQYPLLNSTLSTPSSSSFPSSSSINDVLSQTAITTHQSHSFGIAVATPSGLLVPVLRSVETQSITDIARSIASLSQRAKANQLTMSDLKGASFTISNIGSLTRSDSVGGVVAPVIVSPQVGIVGIGRSRVVPWFDDKGILGKREELVLSWSADHRVVDGAEVARLGDRVAEILEGGFGELVVMS